MWSAGQTRKGRSSILGWLVGLCHGDSGLSQGFVFQDKEFRHAHPLSIDPHLWHGHANHCRIAALAMTACAGMTQQEKNTAIGAGVGAIGGAILTGGSTTGTLGGAAVGGVVGHEVNKK